MSKAQNTQYMIFWSIVGPVALVLSLFLISAVFLALATPNSDSLASGVGAVLYYCSWFGAAIAAPVVVCFSLLGLFVLPSKQVTHKALTLALCAAGVVVSLVLAGSLVLGGRSWLAVCGPAQTSVA